MWKAKENFLWFKKGQEVEEIQDNWEPHFEKLEEPKLKKKESVKKKTVKKKSKKKKV